MRKFLWGAIIPLIAVFLFFFLSMLDGCGNLFGQTDRRTMQISLAQTVLPLLAFPAIALWCFGRLAHGLKKPTLGVALTEASSVFIAFFFGAAYAQVAAMRDGPRIIGCIAAITLWIGVFERHPGKRRWRRPILLGVTAMTWAMIRLIAG